MIIYLIKSGFCLALLLVIYHFILEKEKMHQFNRFYLLSSILFSFYAPSFIIYTEPIIINEAIQPLFSDVIEINNVSNNVITPFVSTPKNNIDFNLIFMVLYILISSLLLFRFSKNIFKITSKIRNNKRKTYKNATIVLIAENIIPHTFLHYIFINKKEFNRNSVEDELFTHELTHVSQKHTIDILLVEILHIICWFNPFIIYLKKAIKLNHEFLADDSVIHSHKNTTEYQHLLLNKATLKNNSYLASNFNYSLTKKRLIMMTKQSSQLKMLFKKIAIIPLVFGLLFLFANRVEAQIVEKSKTEKITTNLYKNDTIKLYKEFYYKDGKISFKDKNGKKITKSYEELTEKEKAKIPPPPLLKSKENIPTKTQLNNWLDSKTYGLWIDGKKVNNSVLKKYKSSDFSSYFLSKIHKNTVNYGKYIYQLNLQTNDYFQSLNQKSANAFKKYKKSKKELKNIPPPPPIPAKATKEQKKAYKKATEKYKKSQKELKNIPPPPPKKTTKDLFKDSYELSLVKKAPIFPTCESSNSEFDRRVCLSEGITRIFKENFNFKLAKKLKQHNGKTHISANFVINKDGSITYLYGYPYKGKFQNELREELIRVLNLIPQLKPAIRKGVPVNVRYRFAMEVIGDNIKSKTEGSYWKPL